MTIVSLTRIWTEQPPYQTALEACQHFHWSVIPLEEDKRPPKVGGVHPDGTPKRLAWKQYQFRRASPQEITRWQKAYEPQAWAVVTGAVSGLLILDFDGEEGNGTCRQLELDPHVHTGSGGYHVYFKHPGWPVPTLNRKSKEALGRRWPGLDIRADGGYGAFCGQNTHGPYTWLREPVLEDVSRLPEDLRAFLGLLSAPEAALANEENVVSEDPVVQEGLEDVLLERALAMIATKKSGRNDAGFWLACQLRDNAFPQEAAERVMQAYARSVPSVNRKGKAEPYTLEEALASVRSAYHEEARHPWESSAAPAPQAASQGRGGSDRGGRVATGTAAPLPNNLPEILIGGDQLRDSTDQALDAVLQQERKNPTLFLQSARLVRMARNEMKRPIIAQMGVTEVKEVLTHAANFYQLRKVPGTEDEYSKRPISPPKELAEQILARQTQQPYLPFPPLVALVETPVIRPDGTILDEAGYDEQTQLYYAPQQGMETCKVPDNPTQEEREAALALIWETIGEFPYVEEADKANALGLCLTPLVRSAIKRHVPMAIIDAPKPGSGKGLLSDVVATIATGSSAAILTLSESEEELQKAITSLLIEGTTIITIDNVSGRLQSRHLDAVLTADIWRGRILGQSKMAHVPQRATWMATGNNVKIGGDLARRCYRIRLDPKVSRPWLRDGFTHSDLASWVVEQRTALIFALLTLARAWFVAGSPRYDHIPALGTFTSWSKTIGGILEYAGVRGFLSNLEKLYDEADEDSAEWEGFLQAWLKQIGETWMTVADLTSNITVAGSDDPCGECELVEALPMTLQIALKDKPQSFKQRLGKALEKRVDACFGQENVRLEKKADPHRKVSRWRVVRGVAGVIPAPREEKIPSPSSADPDEKMYSSDWNHSRHSPQRGNGEDAENQQSGLTGELSGYGNQQGEASLPANADQLPATDKTDEKSDPEEWEDFDL